MNDKAIHATCYLQIGGVLQIAWMVAIGAIGVSIHGHRLSSYIAFSIEVGHRCRLADVALRHRLVGIECLRARVHRPHGSHRNVGMMLRRHTVDKIEASVLMGFEISFHATRVGDVCSCLVHALADELANGGAPVEEELFAAFGTLHNLSRQHRHPRQEAIATPLLELLGQTWRPRLPTGFVAIDEQIVQAPLSHQSASSITIEVEIIVQEVAESLTVHLRHFQSRCFRRGRVILLACERIAETQNAPPPFRSLPRQSAIGIHVLCYIDDVGQHHGIFC